MKTLVTNTIRYYSSNDPTNISCQVASKGGCYFPFICYVSDVIWLEILILF